MSRSAAIVLSLALGVAAPVAAGTLATPLLIAKDGETVNCSITNIGTKPVRDVVSEMIVYTTNAGTVAESNGPVELAPLASTGAGDAAGPGVKTYVCRFTFKGSAKLLRANGTIGDLTFNVIDTQRAY
jgi:hypothetical protein